MTHHRHHNVGPTKEEVHFASTQSQSFSTIIYLFLEKDVIFGDGQSQSSVIM